MSERKWPNGVAYNQHYLWFHVLEDEISHRGQIRMLKNKLFESYVKYCSFYRRIPYNENNQNKNGVMYYGENNLYE